MPHPPSADVSAESGGAPGHGASRPAAATPPQSRIRVAGPRDGHTDRLELNLRRIAERAAGRVGLTATHVESGATVSVRGGERFPMASVYKLPIAIQLLSRVDRGELSLDAPIPITLRDLRPGHSALTQKIARRLDAPDTHRRGGGSSTPFTVPLGALLARMVANSDNTASDLVLREAGGPAEVTARLRSLGLGAVRVDRTESELFMDFYGISTPPADGWWTLVELERRAEAVRPLRRRAAAERFARDPRDTATPEAIARLLVRLQRGELLAPESTQRLLALMIQTPTGPARLRGQLPRDTVVAHKTGTTGTTGGRTAGVNDAGIITLPDGSHLVLAIFVRGAPGDIPTAEATIARLARAAWDHWTSDPLDG